MAAAPSAAQERGNGWKGTLLIGAGALVGTAALLAVAKKLRRCCRPCKRTVPADTPEKGDPHAALVLYDVPGFIAEGVSGLASSPSPFVAKVETFLRFVGLDYTKVPAAPAQGPKGQLPFITQGELSVGDSELIIEYLGRTYGRMTTGVLLPANTEEAGVAVAVTRLACDHLLWAAAYFRFVDPLGWEATRTGLLSRLPVPAPLRALAQRRFRAGALRKLKGQGFGAHSPKDVLSLAAADIKALSGILGGKRYFCGSKPYAVDAAVFGVLDLILHGGLAETDLGKAVQQYPNLVRYVANIRKRYYKRDN